MPDQTIALAKDLIRKQSVTPEDAGCLEQIAERLQAVGFTIERLDFDDVKNLWARKGTEGPLFAFAGHTDVVPTGPESDWTFPPFEPTEYQGKLYGRGAADMKGSVAAMVTAVERFVESTPDHKGSMAFLLTSDEEGPAVNGTVKVVEALEARNEKIDWCLVGEPSSTRKLGDIVKNGRRGSLNGKLTIKGSQGHVAYPHLANNAVHICLAPLKELCDTIWDEGNDHFPPTSFQISNINAGTGATNVIPGAIEALINFRFSTEQTANGLKQKVETLLSNHGLDYEIDWTLSGEPFLTEAGDLVDAIADGIESVTGYATKLSTAGGTSDGRFIAPTGAQVVELGPINATIHKVDEHVSVEDLITLSKVYQRILDNLLS